MNLTLYSVQSIIILDKDGNRVFARYFQAPHVSAPNPYPTTASQKTFEASLHQKVGKQNSDVILLDGKVICYKNSVDLMIYVVGSGEENELMLYAVVMAIRESLEMLLRISIDKRTLLENYDLLGLTVDEIIDDGIVLETDPVTITTRVSRAPVGGENGMPLDFSEKGLLNAYQMAKQKLKDQILQG